MARKFLVFSCLVFLTSFVYFIYTSYQLRESPTETENQQEVIGEFKQPLFGRVSTTHSLQSKQENSNPEPTAEEWSEFEEILSDLEELAETPQLEEISETDISKAEGNGTGISPELETIFIRVRDIQTQKNALIGEVADLYIEESEIQARQIEIGTKELLISDPSKTRQLHEELKILHERRVELDAILDPYDEEIERLEDEFEQEYGMSFEEFHERYDSVYRSWERR